MNFKYVAYDNDKEIVTGLIDLAGEAPAEDYFSKLGLRLLSIKPGKEKRGKSFQESLAAIKTRDIIEFSREMATLLSSGISLLNALQMLNKKSTNILMRQVISSLSLDIVAGNSFSSAISRHPKIFSPIYIQLLKISEKTGNLEQILNRLADYMERQWSVLNRIKQAMIYPSIILFVAIISITILTTITLPALIEMFQQFDQELPLVTRLMIYLVNGLISYKFFILAALFLGVLFFYLFMRRPAGKRFRDRLLSKIPLVGNTILLSQLSYLAQNMSLLIHSGLNIPEVLHLTAEASGNTLIKKEINNLRKEVAQGRKVSESMEGSKLYPPLFLQMVAVGEETATLDSKLLTISQLYHREVDQRISLMLTLIEPAMLVGIGLVVAFIGISIIMPIFSIMSSIQ